METSRSIYHEYSTGENEAEIFSLRWSLDDTNIATGCSDGSIKLYSAPYGVFIRSMNCKITSETYPVTSIRWRPDKSSNKTKNVLLATTCDGGIFHWHASSGKILHTLKLKENQALSCDYNNDGTSFAIGCKDKSVKVFDEGNKEKIADLTGGNAQQLGHDNRIMSVKWVDCNCIMTGGWDNNILIWDLRNNQVIKSFYGPRVYGDSLDIKGDLILAGSYNIEEQVQIWSKSEERCVFSENLISGDTSCKAYTVQFSKFDNGETFAVGGVGGNQFYIYDTEAKKHFGVLDSVNKGVYSLDFANNSDRIALGCGDGSMKVFRYIEKLEENDLED
ncbi:hypothetical protein SteCoe_30015 [Stentor coeruleus]|uniref:Anaphase-promoting complex subunit 4-like WD40 domain-containing protein n=1 Tax=Stentor coeruleus TaxID=5963 RepID=A0A1R2B4N6_9CILI|nr:hypothetical protein SteCoe_30015 [Stentor coeruleus]